MADGPQPTPNAYVDPANRALEAQIGQLSGGKPLQSLSLPQQRALFNKAQSHEPDPNITSSVYELATACGNVKVSVYKPKNSADPLPATVHLHGGDWTFGDVYAWEPFIFDLVHRTQCAVVYPEYALAPDFRYPVQQEQCLFLLQEIVRNGAAWGLNTDKVVLSGDSAGTQLSLAVCLLSNERQIELPIAHLILLYPIVNLTSVGDTYSEYVFQDGPFVSTQYINEILDTYIPDGPAHPRQEITASPALITSQVAKAAIPPTTIILAQQDWLRDEGLNFARKLQEAGVPCGFLTENAVLHECDIFVESRASPTSALVMAALASVIRSTLF